MAGGHAGPPLRGTGVFAGVGFCGRPRGYGRKRPVGNGLDRSAWFRRVAHTGAPEADDAKGMNRICLRSRAHTGAPEGAEENYNVTQNRPDL